MIRSTPLIRKAMVACLACLTGLSLVACSDLSALSGRAATSGAKAGSCDKDLGPTGNTRLATIQQLLDDKKPYAALAELDALGADSPKAILLRAEALRQVERHGEARAQYDRLLNTCLAASAHHGLGLMAAKDGHLKEAIQSLQAARLALPTDANVRNDYGYALLLDRRWNDAQFEFLTVLDLMPNDARASRNLLLLALAQGKTDLAQQLANKLKLDPASLQRMGAQATEIRQSAAALLPPGSAAPIPPLTASSAER
jgi:Flp pilus assembly protein TadD